MPRVLTLVLALVLACLAVAGPAAASEVLVVGGGHSTLRDDPTLPPAAATELAPPPFVALAARGPRAAAAGPTVSRVLIDAHISAADRARYRGMYLGAVRTARRLRGYRRSELDAVIASVRDIAARGQLTVSRLHVVLFELQRNAQFWPHGTLPAPPQQGVGLGGTRVEFGDDPVVFQWYPGDGLRIQQLATFGKVNALAAGCQSSPRSCDRTGLRRALDRIAFLADTRYGFLAWEYLFRFGGGAPPWMSGMAQGTAIQALTRGSKVLGDPSYLRLARRGLVAFERLAPIGVRVRTARGAHYVLYSFAPSYFVLNGFLQSLVGLYDFAAASGDALAHRLFADGDREARHELPAFDTGAWSLYSLDGVESDLGYHTLARDFLRRLCKRTSARAYCADADRYTRYLHEPPRIEIVGVSPLRAGRTSFVRLRLSKRGTVTLTVARGATTVARVTRSLVRGGALLPWRPSRPGSYRLTLDAHDLAGNAARTSADVTVR